MTSLQSTAAEESSPVATDPAIGGSSDGGGAEPPPVALTDTPPGNRPPPPGRVGERLKLSVALAANLAFLPAVVLMWAIEGPCLDSHQLPGVDLVIFAIGELILIIYYGLLIEPATVTSVLDLLTAAAKSGVPVRGGESGGTPRGAGTLQRFLTNAWTPVTLNFWLVGWLIYSTGGITTSPYSSVPLSMIIIGQSVYAIPPIQLRPTRRTPRLLVFIWSVARLYWSSLLVVVSLLVALVLLQLYAPVHRAPARSGEVFLVTLVSLFASMCVTFVTRRGDQGGRPHDR